MTNLIDDSRGSWKAESIRDMSIPFKADKILSIPISFRKQENKLVWHYIKNGRFMVRSSYYLATSIFLFKDNSTSAATCNHVWPFHELWNLKIPPKIQMLSWRCAHNIFLIRSNLQRRGVMTISSCKRYGETGKTIEHALKDCHWAAGIWFLSPLGLRSMQIQLSSEKVEQDWGLLLEMVRP